MLGKIVQIFDKPYEEGFEVMYGIEDCEHYDRYCLDFATLLFVNPDESKTHILEKPKVKKNLYGFKELTINNKKMSEDDNEEYLLVIISHATQLETYCRRVAGRYYGEAILEMREGNILELSKNISGEREIFVVVREGKELFLIKENR